MLLHRRAVLRAALLLSATLCPDVARAAISFQPPRSVPKLRPAAFTTADMDSDGRADLVALGGDEVTVLYGRGDGTFSDRVNLPLGDGINLGQSDILAADINTDGAPDLVVPYFGLNRITVFMNRGGGQFAPAVNYAVGSSPETLTAGDFNNDGKLDVAVANHHGHNMCVLLNRGDGTLLAAVFYGGGSYAGRVLTGDFNGDGNLDLSMSNLVSADASVYLGNGTGKFTGVGSYHANGGYAAEMATDDFNGDGKPDLAVANWHNGTISILAGDGSGAFAAAVNFASNANPYTTAAPDLDGDGDPDLVVANGEQAHFTVLENHESGNFLPPLTIPRDGRSRAMAVADFNGDERPDVAVGTLDPDTIAVYLNSSPRPTPAVRSLSLTPTPVTGGCDALQGAVNLTAPAPVGGVAVALSSSNPAVTVPPNVTIQGGEISARFTATASSVSSAQTGTVLASHQGSGRRAAFRVNPGGSASLTLTPRSLIGGEPATGEITLACPAGSGGLTVTLATSHAGAAQVPGTVHVPVGASRATFPVQTRAVTAAASVVITAAVDGRTLTGTLEVRPTPPLPPPPGEPTFRHLLLFPNPVISGQVATGQVVLRTFAGPGGLVVPLASSHPAAAVVPLTITVPAGATGVTFPIITFPVAALTPVEIRAGVPGDAVTATLQLQPGVGTAGNLLVNGSFEEPDVSGSPYLYGFAYGPEPKPGYPSYRGPTIPGWRITRGTLDVVRQHWGAIDGKQSIDLVGSPGAATIEQSFATTPGREYVFSGYVSHNPDTGYGRADVLLDGRAFTQLVHLSSTRSRPLWAHFVYHFRAISPTTTLTIVDLHTDNPVRGTALDGLSVTPADMPITPAAGAVPAVPGNLAARTEGAGQIEITWSDDSPNETGFTLHRQAGGNAAEKVALGAGVTRFVDRNAQPGVTYRYWIQSQNESGTAGFTGPVQVTSGG